MATFREETRQPLKAFIAKINTGAFLEAAGGRLWRANVFSAQGKCLFRSSFRVKSPVYINKIEWTELINTYYLY